MKAGIVARFAVDQQAYLGLVSSINQLYYVSLLAVPISPSILDL